MNEVLKFSACVLLLAGIQCGPFHCSRSSQPCRSGAMCTKDGNCTCPSGFQGDDCSIVTEDIIESGCKVVCKNGGLCVRKGKDDACACSVLYYGKYCSEKRYQIKCTVTHILFNINPVGTFSGTAAVVNKENITLCRSTPVPKPPVEGDDIPDTWQGHVLALKYDDVTCGKMEPVQTSDEEVVEFNATVNIDYGKSEIGDEFRGICSVRYESYVKVTSGLGIGIENTTKPTTTTTTTQRSIGGVDVIHISFTCFVVTSLIIGLNYLSL